MVDIFLSSLFLYLFVSGIHRGFLEILIKVLILGGGIWLSFRYLPSLSSFLSHYFSAKKTILDFLSFFLIFFPFLGFSIWFNSFIHKGIKKKKALSIFNKILGGIVSLFAFVIFLFFLVDFSYKYPNFHKILEHSKIIELFHISK